MSDGQDLGYLDRYEVFEFSDILRLRCLVCGDVPNYGQAGEFLGVGFANLGELARAASSHQIAMYDSDGHHPVKPITEGHPPRD